jgi:hypothetical protein
MTLQVEQELVKKKETNADEKLPYDDVVEH